MSLLNTVVANIHRNLRAVMPQTSVLIEASGFLLLGLGLFLGLAIFTFNPVDYVAGDYSAEKISNMAGPLGAYLASVILGYFGAVGMIYPMAFAFWGAVVVLGFAVTPEPRRLIGFLILMIVLAVLVQVQFSEWAFTEPSFGYGGKIGKTFATPMLAKMGYGGSLLSLIIFALFAMVISGNLAISRTKSYLRYLWFHFSAYTRKMYDLTKVSVPKSEEDLIRDALREELKHSRTLQRALVTAKDKPKDSDELEPLDPKNKPDLQTDSKKPRRKKRTPEDLVGSVDLKDITDDVADHADEIMAEADGKKAEADGTGGAGAINFYYDGPSHDRPRASMFTWSTKAKVRESELKKMADKLAHQLRQFKVEGRVTKINEGPVVTTYEFEPVAGTKISKVEALSKDLARLLQATSLRILAPIPGKQVLGFEVPNKERRVIGFADLADHKDLKSQKIALPIAMGLDAFGKVVIEDLAKMPHLLVAGSTGSGKSVFMNTLIGSLIARHSAKDLRFVMVDPKMVELAAYNDLPHMACPVITDPQGEAKSILDALVHEMEERFRRMRELGARNIAGYNEIIKSRRKTEFPKFNSPWQPMPFIVLIIDELADMMMVLGKDAEIPITRLAQKARAAGIHLVIATQRPSAEVVTGLIKANFPTRVAFRVLSGLDSRTILDSNGAEMLLGQGDMLYLNAAGLRRMHGAFLNDGEVHKMVKVCKVK